MSRLVDSLVGILIYHFHWSSFNTFPKGIYYSYYYL